MHCIRSTALDGFCRCSENIGFLGLVSVVNGQSAYFHGYGGEGTHGPRMNGMCFLSLMSSEKSLGVIII